MLQLPQVIGHRGAMAYAPENTLASFREARRRGARWVEIDVKLTADRVPILMHDAARRAARRVADLRAGDRLLPGAGIGLQRRDQAVRGARGRDRARHGRDAA